MIPGTHVEKRGRDARKQRKSIKSIFGQVTSVGSKAQFLGDLWWPRPGEGTSGVVCPYPCPFHHTQGTRYTLQSGNKSIMEIILREFVTTRPALQEMLKGRMKGY